MIILVVFLILFLQFLEKSNNQLTWGNWKIFAIPFMFEENSLSLDFLVLYKNISLWILTKKSSSSYFSLFWFHHSSYFGKFEINNIYFVYLLFCMEYFSFDFFVFLWNWWSRRFSMFLFPVNLLIFTASFFPFQTILSFSLILWDLREMHFVYF